VIKVLPIYVESRHTFSFNVVLEGGLGVRCWVDVWWLILMWFGKTLWLEWGFKELKGRNLGVNLCKLAFCGCGVPSLEKKKKTRNGLRHGMW
jgi:hypothetical protein